MMLRSLLYSSRICNNKIGRILICFANCSSSSVMQRSRSTNGNLEMYRSLLPASVVPQPPRSAAPQAGISPQQLCSPDVPVPTPPSRLETNPSRPPVSQAPLSSSSVLGTQASPTAASYNQPQSSGSTTGSVASAQQLSSSAFGATAIQTYVAPTPLPSSSGSGIHTNHLSQISALNRPQAGAQASVNRSTCNPPQNVSSLNSPTSAQPVYSPAMGTTSIQTHVSPAPLPSSSSSGLLMNHQPQISAPNRPQAGAQANVNWSTSNPSRNTPSLYSPTSPISPSQSFAPDPSAIFTHAQQQVPSSRTQDHVSSPSSPSSFSSSTSPTSLSSPSMTSISQGQFRGVGHDHSQSSPNVGSTFSPGTTAAANYNPQGHQVSPIHPLNRSPSSSVPVSPALLIQSQVPQTLQGQQLSPTFSHTRSPSAISSTSSFLSSTSSLSSGQQLSPTFTHSRLPSVSSSTSSFAPSHLNSNCVHQTTSSFVGPYQTQPILPAVQIVPASAMGTNSSSNFHQGFQMGSSLNSGFQGSSIQLPLPTSYHYQMNPQMSHNVPQVGVATHAFGGVNLNASMSAATFHPNQSSLSILPPSIQHATSQGSGQGHVHDDKKEVKKEGKKLAKAILRLVGIGVESATGVPLPTDSIVDAVTSLVEFTATLAHPFITGKTKNGLGLSRDDLRAVFQAAPNAKYELLIQALIQAQQFWMESKNPPLFSYQVLIDEIRRLQVLAHTRLTQSNQGQGMIRMGMGTGLQGGSVLPQPLGVVPGIAPASANLFPQQFYPAVGPFVLPGHVQAPLYGHHQ